jgi:hypothetical protein
MKLSEVLIEPLQNYLRQLTQQTRSRLLVEVERLKLCGEELPGSDFIVANLQAELRKDGKPGDSSANPQRYFFEPLEPLLINAAPERANGGQISRGSLVVIWEWIRLTVLPTMANEYSDRIRRALAADKPREARQAAVAFQTKIATYLTNTLASSEGAEQARAGLALYTSSRATFDDLVKILTALRARDALAAFYEALPSRIDKFDDKEVAKVSDRLNALRAKHPDAVPFALVAIIARLKTPWQLIRLATKAANSKVAADLAKTDYAIAIPMVLDHLDDRRLALRDALKRKRMLAAKEILADIYAIEYALRVRIDLLDRSPWGDRLNALILVVTEMVDSEARSVPEHLRNFQHVLKSRSLRSHDSLTGRLTYLVWKGRDALSGGSNYFKKLVGQG